MTTATSDSPPSKLDRFVESYRKEHVHPVNHFLHVWVGWPLCALAVILLPFRPLWSPGLVFAGYVFMWTGHFVFERNTPTIFKHPSTPFVMAWAVFKGLVLALVRGIAPAKKK